MAVKSIYSRPSPEGLGRNLESQFCPWSCRKSHFFGPKYWNLHTFSCRWFLSTWCSQTDLTGCCIYNTNHRKIPFGLCCWASLCKMRWWCIIKITLKYPHFAKIILIQMLQVQYALLMCGYSVRFYRNPEITLFMLNMVHRRKVYQILCPSNEPLLYFIQKIYQEQTLVLMFSLLARSLLCFLPSNSVRNLQKLWNLFSFNVLLSYDSSFMTYHLIHIFQDLVIHKIKIFLKLNKKHLGIVKN